MQSLNIRCGAANNNLEAKCLFLKPKVSTFSMHSLLWKQEHTALSPYCSPSHQDSFFPRLLRLILREQFRINTDSSRGCWIKLKSPSCKSMETIRVFTLLHLPVCSFWDWAFSLPRQSYIFVALLDLRTARVFFCFFSTLSSAPDNMICLAKIFW